MAEAQKTKWTNPSTGTVFQLGNQRSNRPVGGGVDMDQLLDLKYKAEAGFGAGARVGQPDRSPDNDLSKTLNKWVDLGDPRHNLQKA